MQIGETVATKVPLGGSLHSLLLGDQAARPITACIPKTQENKHLYENGVSHLLPRLTLKVHTNIEECYDLWEAFTSNKTLFDLWDFRYAWHKGYDSTPFFYTLYEDKTPLALMPLMYDDEEKLFMWFGTEWMEDNTFAVADPKFIDVLLAIAPTPLHLNALEITNPDKFKKDIVVTPDHLKNIKDISGFSSLTELLATFKKKHRYNLRADFRRLSKRSLDVVHSDSPTIAELEPLIVLNKKRFDGVNKEKSAFEDAGEVKAFENIIKNAGRYKVKFINVYDKGNLISSDMMAIYNGIYYPMRGGNNVADYHGIGNYMMYLEFEDAMKLNCRVIDCLQEDNGWKHRYFDSRQVYLLKK